LGQKKGILLVANLILKFKGICTQTFYIVDLGEDYMLLGMSFLAATNPEIDWSNRMFKGKIEASTPDAYHKPLPLQAEDPVVTIHMQTSLLSVCLFL
jgi:hypothetical protein